MKTIEDAARDHCNIKKDLIIDEEERYYRDFQKYDGFKAGAEFVIDELVSKFEQLKQSATTLRDVVYLDGVLTVIESMKIENNN